MLAQLARRRVTRAQRAGTSLQVDQLQPRAHIAVLGNFKVRPARPHVSAAQVERTTPITDQRHVHPAQQACTPAPRVANTHLRVGPVLQADIKILLRG